MRLRNSVALGIASALVLATAFEPALSQQLYIYPSAGQTPQQVDQDRYECHVWAVQQTGYDPSNPGAAAPQGQTYAYDTGADGSILRGAARGAAVGAVVGEIANDDAGGGAAAGAAGGALLGAFKRHDKRRQQQAQAQASQQQAAQAQSGQQSAYNRAMAACLQGRGYTVN